MFQIINPLVAKALNENDTKELEIYILRAQLIY